MLVRFLSVRLDCKVDKGRETGHQNIPTGGYGMNMGLADAYDIAWKLAMVLKGHGGEDLMASYEFERRPVAVRNVQRAAEHKDVHRHYVTKTLEAGSEVMLGDSKKAREIKEYTKKHVDTTDGENKDTGIEMDYRFRGSPVVVTEIGAEEPEWRRQAYFPSTLPGSRAPHVFLSDDATSIYDLLGKEYTVVDFSRDGTLSSRIEMLAKAESLPISRLHLPAEAIVGRVWERDVVLVRPDHFVAWRSRPVTEYGNDSLREILRKVFGQRSTSRSVGGSREGCVNGNGEVAFAGVERSFNQDEERVERLAEFQG